MHLCLMVCCTLCVARRAAEAEAWDNLLGWLDDAAAASTTLTQSSQPLTLSEVVERKRQERAAEQKPEAAAQGAAESGGAEALRFVIAHGGMEVTEEGAVVTKTDGGYGFRCAAGPALGPAGVHWAEFVNESGSGSIMLCGLILDGWDVAGGSDADEVDGHCFFGTHTGNRMPGGHKDWPGRQPAKVKGDRIGMRLDLGAGSLTVFKNGALLGVMQGSGLEGRAYRWAVSLGDKGCSMRLAAPSAASVAAMEA